MLTRLKSPEAAVRWLQQWCSGELRTDSRQVQPGDAFIAWPGHAQDGRNFVEAALRAGATTCLVEARGVEAFAFDDARIAALNGLKAATGPIADSFLGAPTASLDIIASTGTNGKTSTAWWVAQALNALGRRCGVVGTLGVGVPPDVVFTGLTTPDPVTLQSAFQAFKADGMSAVAIEASSIGVEEQRMAGTRVAVALLTNFTQDHLDYHGSMAAYWQAKRALFNWPGLRAAVVNIDDAQGAALAAELGSGAALGGAAVQALHSEGAERLALWTVSTQLPARLRAQGLRYVDGGLAFEVCEGSDQQALRSHLIGDYNAHNLLVVLGALRALGIPLAEAVAVVPQLTPVPGRMQRVAHGAAGPEVVVDYAHTPDALEKVLQSLQPLAAARGGALWCVFGCGGDRDARKRPLMGAIAQSWAQKVVITSDNPRSEDPAQIVAQIAAGLVRDDADPALVRPLARVQQVLDRAQAIQQALLQAQPQDVVLIAGKGHEDYQDIQGVKTPFSDAAHALLALEQRP